MLDASVSLGELKAAFGTVIKKGTPRAGARNASMQTDIVRIAPARVRYLMGFEFCALARRSDATLRIAERLRAHGFVRVRDVVELFEPDLEMLGLRSHERRMLKECLSAHELVLGMVVPKA
jgi:hypothetical protein